VRLQKLDKTNLSNKNNTFNIFGEK